jgi:hypothetical protein
MNAVGRYLRGSLVSASIYYVVGLVLWPGKPSPIAAILIAVGWGLAMQGLLTRRERLTRQGKEPYPAALYLGSALLGLGLCAWCWRSNSPTPTEAEFYGLISVVLYCLYLLACGVAVTRRLRASSGATASGSPIM